MRRARHTGQRGALRRVFVGFVGLVGFVGVSAAAGAGCSGTTIPQGGLMLVLSTDGTLPQATRLHIEISSSNGAATYRNADYQIPMETTLPATLGIATNGSATASVAINASLWAGDTILDDRQNQLYQIPTDRVVELAIVFSANCTPRAVVEDGGAGSNCPPGETCDPTNGGCTGDSVSGSSLPVFGEDAGHARLDAGATDATLAPDAGEPDSGSAGGEDSAAPPLDAASPFCLFDNDASRFDSTCVFK